MDEEEDKGRTDIEKKKILAILPTNQELQGDIYNVKLYSSDREGVDWLYSGLEGNLAFVVDFQIKTKYLMLFDPIVRLLFNLANAASSCLLAFSLSAGGKNVCSILSKEEFLSLFSLPRPTITFLNKEKAKSKSLSKSFLLIP